MSSPTAQFYKALNRAQTTATLVVGAAYQAIDVLFFKGDEFQNSAGLALEQAITEVDALKIGEFVKYANSIREAKIVNMLMGAELIKDPMLKRAYQQRVQDEIKKDSKRQEKIIEIAMKRIAKLKAENKNNKAIDRQLAKLTVNIASSSQDQTDSERETLAEVEHSIVQSPDELSVSA